MGEFTRIVTSALEYYDENRFSNYDVIKTFKYYNLSDDKSEIMFFNRDGKKILTTKYEIIGKFIHDKNMWVWGWSSGELSKDQIKVSRKVLNYALDLELEDIPLKTEFVTSRYQISSTTQLDIHTALAIYLSKKKFTYELLFAVSDDQSKITDNNGNEYSVRPTHPTNTTGLISYYLILD